MKKSRLTDSAIKGLIVIFFMMYMVSASMTIARADVIEELAARAAQEGTIIWYESSAQETADKFVARFHKRFPKVKLEHVRMTGGQLAGRVIQEIQASGHSCDVGTTGPSDTWKLNERGLSEHIDWKSLGIQEKMIEVPFAVGTCTSANVMIYNTDMIQEEDAPKNWEDMINPRWKNKVATGTRQGTSAQLAAVWGEEKVTQWLEALIKLNPVLFKSSVTLTQAVGAGEIAVGTAAYHSTLPTVRKGAPIKMVPLDPTVIWTIYSFVLKSAQNPNGARLLIAWMMTAEGAQAYEETIGRGNHLVPTSETAKFLKGKRIAQWPLDQLDTYRALYKKFTTKVERGVMKKH